MKIEQVFHVWKKPELWVYSPMPHQEFKEWMNDIDESLEFNNVLLKLEKNSEEYFKHKNTFDQMIARHIQRHEARTKSGYRFLEHDNTI